jgi:hypothetical protein
MFRDRSHKSIYMRPLERISGLRVRTVSWRDWAACTGSAGAPAAADRRFPSPQGMDPQRGDRAEGHCRFRRRRPRYQGTARAGGR